MTILHRIELATVRGFLALFRALPPVTASNLGGALGRTIGPMIPTSKVADANLRRVMPELDAAARRKIIRDVWENLARTAAEFPHLADLRETASGPGYELVGTKHILELAARGGPAIGLTGHIGNWEIIPPVADRLGVPLAFFYRAADNKAVDDVILRLREKAMGRKVTMFAKGAAGARASYIHLLQGGFLGMLVDQKLNDGIAVPFFGLPAMTAPTPAVFARRFHCPILALHVERLGPARLRIVFEPPYFVEPTADKEKDIETATAWMNLTIERWIRARPGEWLWLHRRWPKDTKPKSMA
ncbi:MAG TPA: lauroyl acyltransferase [Acidiphilium sp.]